jgi:hypothetical protein
VRERRFYVHEDAFADLARDFPQLAPALLELLGLALAGRIARHQLVGGGEEIGLVARDTFGPGVHALEDRAHTGLTRLFRQVVFAAPELADADGTQPLLGPAEQICATCAESGYLTFATGPAEADIMYAETGSLRALRRDVRARPGAYPDLTLVSGRKLFAFTAAIGTGPGTHARYQESRGPGSGVEELIEPATARVLQAVDDAFPDGSGGGVEETLLRSFRDTTTASLSRLLHRLAQSMSRAAASASR